MKTTTKKRLEKDKASPRRVDYFGNASDFQCVLLAAIGLSTEAIAGMTDLTVGQVMYRIMKSQSGRRKGEPSERMKYRNGSSDVVQTVISTVASSPRSSVVKKVSQQLDDKGLYTPVPNGVMKHNGNGNGNGR